MQSQRPPPYYLRGAILLVVLFAGAPTRLLRMPLLPIWEFALSPRRHVRVAARVNQSVNQPVPCVPMHLVRRRMPEARLLHTYSRLRGEASGVMGCHVRLLTLWDLETLTVTEKSSGNPLVVSGNPRRQPGHQACKPQSSW